MPLTFDEVSRIVAIIDSSSCDELVVETEDIKLVIRRRNAGAAPTGPQASAVAATSAPALPEGGPAPDSQPSAGGSTPAARDFDREGSIEVVAPMVGTFYITPAPDKPPFVQVGSTIAAGDPLCVIEVMKLFTTVFAQQSGRIVQIFPENGQLVEHGQLLFVLEPT